jgi:hypothetical protein
VHRYWCAHSLQLTVARQEVEVTSRRQLPVRRKPFFWHVTIVSEYQKAYVGLGLFQQPDMLSDDGEFRGGVPAPFTSVQYFASPTIRLSSG